jgi:hypothetical protein
VKECEKQINQSFPYIDLYAIVAVSLKTLYGFNDKKDSIIQTTKATRYKIIHNVKTYLKPIEETERESQFDEIEDMLKVIELMVDAPTQNEVLT